MWMKIADAAVRLMQLYPKIFFACHRTHVRDSLTKELLSSHQVNILEHLDDAEPTSMTRLAMHMGVTPSTMSLAIDRLEQRGYVSRERDPLDARRVELRLTKNGMRIKEAQSVLEPRLVRSMIARLSPSKREAALSGLALLAAAAQEEMRRRASARHWRQWKARPQDSPN